MNIKANTAYSIAARQTLDEQDKTRIDLYSEHVGDIAPQLKELGIRYLAADAHYSPKKYDGKIDFKKDLSRFEYVRSLDDRTNIYAADVYSVSLKKEIQVVLLKSTGEEKARAILFRGPLRRENCL